MTGKEKKHGQGARAQAVLASLFSRGDWRHAFHEWSLMRGSLVLEGFGSCAHPNLSVRKAGSDRHELW
eukprot:1156136-Pelagomonas_calceolata.AAC.7